MISKTFTTSILTLCIATFFSTTAFAQPNYLAGYLINNHLDTVKGLIDYRNWERNPTAITFKDPAEDVEKYYLPTDIKEFAVADEIYVSAIVDVMTLDNFSGILLYDAAIKTKKDTVFLQTLARGDKDLLYLEDRDGVDQFYIHLDTAYLLLKYKKYAIEKDGGTSYAENKTYIGQLVYALHDCQDIQDKVKNPGYNKTFLTKLFKAYYECTNQSIQYEKTKEKVGVKIGGLLGVSRTTVKVESNYTYLSDVPLSPSIDVSAGLSFDFVLSRNLGKWSIAEELLYTTYKTSGHYDDPLNPATVELGFSYIKLNNMVRFTTPVGKIFAFGNAGISLGVLIDQVNVKHDESIFHPPMDSPAIYGVNSKEVGYILGAGIGYHAFALHLRYEYSYGFADYPGIATPTKRWYVLGGYTF